MDFLLNVLFGRHSDGDEENWFVINGFIMNPEISIGWAEDERD